MTRSLTVGGFVFSDPPTTDANGARWTLSTLAGWDNSGSGVRRESIDRPGNHGAFGQPGYRTGRSVAFSGFIECATRAAAATVKRSLAALLAAGTDGDLTVSDPDEPTLTSTVGLAAKPEIDWHGTEFVECAFELWAPDPHLYGDPVPYSTEFAADSGGLLFPLFTDGASPVGFLDFGPPSTAGRVTLVNDGTAEARPQFAVSGPVPAEGVDLVRVSTGERITFAGAIADGSTVVLDSATGRALLDGNADRSGLLTRAEWFGVAPGTSETVAFLPRGVRSSATLTATVRSAWW